MSAVFHHVPSFVVSRRPAKQVGLFLMLIVAWCADGDLRISKR